jgi:hypothetical protein
MVNGVLHVRQTPPGEGEPARIALISILPTLLWHRPFHHALMLAGLNSRPLTLTWPAFASAAAILRSERRLPVFGLARCSRLAMAIISASVLSPSLRRARAISAKLFRPSHLPSSARRRTRAAFSFLTRQEYEARIGALERLVGKLALENEFLKGASRHARPLTSATGSVIAGPVVCRSPKDAD